jgi:RNA polymerase sigma factor for flagellar operon FliA
VSWSISSGAGGAAQGEEELRMLWRRVRDHDDSGAKERLILTYAPLVKYVAGRMSAALPSHVDETDLISYGLMGLIAAVERFDPERQVKFETYAVTRIKGSIIDELRSLDWVPRSVRARARAIEQKSTELEHKLHRAPTDHELASALEMNIDEFQTAINQISNSSIVALDEMWNVNAGTDSVALIDTIGDQGMNDPGELLENAQLRETLADAIARLPDREKIVVSLYYYDHLTLREIGEVLGVTESRVSQLHTKAILRLKGRLQDESVPN